MVSVGQIFAEAGLEEQGQVRWGSVVPLDVPGVYVVATTDELTRAIDLDAAPVSESAVQALLDVRPELRVDGRRPTVQEFIARLAEMWVPGEPILYIGLAGSSVRSRVHAYAGTRLGARGPHAGGWPLKMLSVLDDCWVYFAPSDDPNASEAALLGAFASAIPALTTAQLRDRERVMPFANLEFPRGRRKRHGITGACAPRRNKATDPHAGG